MGSRRLIAAVSVSSALLVAAVPVAWTDSGSGRLAVTVTGLQAGSAPRLTLVGPTGKKSMARWKIREDVTVKGLRPGLYAVRARSVFTSGKKLLPEPPISWVPVKPGKVRTVTVTYKPTVPGGSVVLDPINLPQACRWAYGDTWTSKYVDRNDPMSVYCYNSENGQGHNGVDLNAYCIRKYNTDRGYASLRGSTADDWWCFKSTGGVGATARGLR